MSEIKLKGTTILCVTKNGKTAIGGDGQVTLGNTVLKGNAVKVRRLSSNKNIISGFAGSTADAFTLFERLEEKIEKYPTQLDRACVELAKNWRLDKYLRKLEAMMIVTNGKQTFVLTGIGDVLAPEDDCIAIGSGGNYATAAAKALLSIENNLNAEEIVKKSLNIAADLCIYTNNNLTIKTVEGN